MWNDMARAATFRLILDLVDPPRLIELSGEREEDSTPVGEVQTGMNKIPGKKFLAKLPIPVSVVHHAFLELDEERLKLLFGHGHRGLTPSVAVPERRWTGRSCCEQVLQCFDPAVRFRLLSSLSPSMSQTHDNSNSALTRSQHSLPPPP